MPTIFALGARAAGLTAGGRVGSSEQAARENAARVASTVVVATAAGLMTTPNVGEAMRAVGGLVGDVRPVTSASARPSPMRTEGKPETRNLPRGAFARGRFRVSDFVLCLLPDDL